MVLKEVFSDKGQKEIYDSFRASIENIIKDINKKSSKLSEKDIETLERKLTNLFYGSPSSKIGAQYIQDKASLETEQNIIEIFENFDFENIKKRYDYQGKNIAYNSIVKYAALANDLQTKLKDLQQNTTKNPNGLKLTQALTEVEKAINLCNETLNNANLGLYESTKVYGKELLKIKGSQNGELLRSINIILALNATFNNGIASPAEAGKIFEEALAKIDVVSLLIDDNYEALTTPLVRSVSHRTGDIPVKRGGEKVNYIFNDNYQPNKKIHNKTGNFKYSKKNMNVTYSYDPSAPKQAKMDVQFDYTGALGSDYRISAKSWSNGKGDLGETSIDAGLNRAIKVNKTEYYKFAFINFDWWKHYSNFASQSSKTAAAHNLAKLAIKSDIAMGLSQAAGYANLLVVDTGTAIKVRNLADIVLNEDKALAGYSEDKIDELMSTIYRRMKNIRTGRTQRYLAVTSAALNKMKVTINMSV